MKCRMQYVETDQRNCRKNATLDNYVRKMLWIAGNGERNLQCCMMTTKTGCEWMNVFFLASSHTVVLDNGSFNVLLPTALARPVMQTLGYVRPFVRSLSFEATDLWPWFLCMYKWVMAIEIEDQCHSLKSRVQQWWSSARGRDNAVGLISILEFLLLWAWFVGVFIAL